MLFVPPVARALKRGFRGAAPVVTRATNRRCELLDCLLGLGPASTALTSFAHFSQQTVYKHTERTNASHRSPGPPSDMGKTSAQEPAETRYREQDRGATHPGV